MCVCVYAKNPQAVLIPAQHAPAELSGKLSRDFGGALDYIKKQHIKNLHLESVGQILRSGYLTRTHPSTHASSPLNACTQPQILRHHIRTSHPHASIASALRTTYLRLTHSHCSAFMMLSIHSCRQPISQLLPTYDVTTSYLTSRGATTSMS